MDFQLHGAPFDALVFEILPTLPLLHMHVLKFFTGDYDLNSKTMRSWEGPLFYGIAALFMLPLVIYLLPQWYRAGKLRGLVCGSLAGFVAVLTASLIFAQLYYFSVGVIDTGPWQEEEPSAVSSVLALRAMNPPLPDWYDDDASDCDRVQALRTRSYASLKNYV